MDDATNKAIASVVGDGKHRVKHDIGKTNGRVGKHGSWFGKALKFVNDLLEEGIPNRIRRKCVQELGNGVGNFAADAITDAMDRVSYGTLKKGPRPYNSYYDSSVRTYPSQYPYYIGSQQAQAPARPEQSPEHIDYEDVTTMRDRAAAVDLLERMRGAIRTYGNVSVCELFESVGLGDESVPFTFNNYGWTNLDNIVIVRNAAGWWLDLPQARPLK